jgi:serine/threonine-protein kinase HipA
LHISCNPEISFISSIEGRFSPRQIPFVHETCGIFCGHNLAKFIAGTFGIPLREQSVLLESISDAISEVVPLVRIKMKENAGFRDIGKRMLLAWQEGVIRLRDGRAYAAAGWPVDNAFEGISAPPKLDSPRKVLGRSELLGNRIGKPKKAPPK